MHTINALVNALHEIGVHNGDAVMVHASLRAIGRVEHGAAGVVIALDRAVGPEGTLLMTLGADGVAGWASTPPDNATIAQLTLFRLLRPGAFARRA